MDLELAGKSALVTGSTAGIGLAIAAVLAAEGARVIVNGRTQQRVDHAIERSGAAHGIAADLGTEAGARAVIGNFPELDILVNNLGIFEPKAFEKIPDEDWMRFFEVNVLSGVRLSRHYTGPMKRKELGANRVHIQRIGAPDSRRNDSLRDDQDGSAGRLARPRRDHRRNRRHGQRRASRARPPPKASADFVESLARERGADRREVEASSSARRAPRRF